MSWNLLERFLESEHFNKDPSLTVAYLARYADHVGIQYVLCSKLRQFSYEEIEFFLPQLCHLLISLDNESMALEEFMIDLSEESVNAALLTFWLFQTSLRDLSPIPNSNAFKKCRRIYNRVQRIVFGASEPMRREKIKDNVLPVTVLSSIILAGVVAPFLPAHAGPLAIAQARKPRPVEEMISENVQTQRPTRSHTVSGGHQRPRRPRPLPHDSDPAARASRRQIHRTNLSVDVSHMSRSRSPQRAEHRPSRQALLEIQASDGYISSSSLPDTRAPESPVIKSPLSVTAVSEARRPVEMQRRHSHTTKVQTPSALSPRQKVRLLRSNYFKLETQFLTALEDISNRLVAVPKAARLSALRAELALIAQDLPAEVDVPLICPATLDDGTPSKSRHHRIVRLNPAEATSLNSAERVPYLLMVEVLREDFDFDPDSPQNNELIVKLLTEKGKSRRRLFDITDGTHQENKQPVQAIENDSVFEPAMGDLASPALLQDPDDEGKQLRLPGRTPPLPSSSGFTREAPRLPGGVNTVPSSTLITPRNSDQHASRSSSPGPRLSSGLTRAQGADQPDFNALATHMRAASQMLAQLEVSSSKRPKAEVAAIKAKIIASMQTLEEQSFYTDADEATRASNIAVMMENANTIGSSASPDDVDIEGNAETADIDPNSASGAGAARMENDIKTGGVQRGGDRDDPSAATFGEAWEMKKERIRRSSPYGWMPNWDLVSVIVKTGADLRQEAFACQLIAVCDKIWSEAHVDVWVKHMRILVTGESSGLIETITNGVSLHSLKRSLTLSSIESGSNPRKRIASLKDHFVRTFGTPDSAAHVSATENFARSLAAYSVISYVLQLKDRHNGNILISDRGHIIHIDFGFMLSNSPGSMGFEAAPFKLTQEYIDVLGGAAADAPAYKLFLARMKEAFQALRRDAERIVMLVELMGRESRMPCYAGGVASVVAALRGRFVLDRSEKEAETYVEELVAKSAGSYYTRLYDTFQYRTQGIY